MLTRLSAGAIPPDPLIGELQRARARQRREELAAAARSGRSADEVEEDLQSIVNENAGLESRLKELEDKNRELEDENRRLQWRVDWAATPPDDELPPEAIREDPKTWAEVAQRLPELLSDAFVLTHRASEQCASNSYPDPTRMWRVLERLSEAAEDYCSRGARVGNRLSEWLSERYELDVRPFDRRLGSRTFDYGGVTYRYSQMPHVAVDDYKDPSRCGRIYFADDEAHARFIVDHVGLHL
jgi:hypothetical protein